MTSVRYLILILLALVASGCLGPVQELYPEDERQRTVPVYVVELGWHAGLAFKAKHLTSRLPEHSRLPDTGYLLVGWGDDKYYTADRARVDLFLRAAFLPTGSVIHVIGFDRDVDEYFADNDIIRVQVSRQGMEAMTTWLAGRFATGAEGSLQYAAPGLYGQSAFFKANGLYYFPRTSNWWTARVLRKSGFPITPIYAITSGNVMRQAGKEGEVIQRR